MVDIVHKILKKLIKIYDRKWPKKMSSHNICNILKPVKKQFFYFCDFYFLQNGRFCAENSKKIYHNYHFNENVILRTRGQVNNVGTSYLIIKL